MDLRSGRAAPIHRRLRGVALLNQREELELLESLRDLLIEDLLARESNEESEWTRLLNRLRSATDPELRDIANRLLLCPAEAPEVLKIELDPDLLKSSLT